MAPPRRALPDRRPTPWSRLSTNSSRADLAENPRGGGYNLVVRNLTYVLADVPPMAERVLELTVPVAPKHVPKRLAHLGAGRNRLSEHRIGVGDFEGKYDRRAADRLRAKNAHFGELVGDVKHAVADSQLHRHEPSVRRGYPFDLLRAEGITVEGGGALSALDDDVWCDGHAAKVRFASSARIERSCA
jgi:hypothetical protein